ncbi:penicillin acylase family protein [Nocardioides sp. LHD-245]|nr:penicillin acylase family protein [Nocardioides sp. LHD-245]
MDGRLGRGPAAPDRPGARHRQRPCHAGLRAGRLRLRPAAPGPPDPGAPRRPGGGRTADARRRRRRARRRPADRRRRAARHDRVPCRSHRLVRGARDRLLAWDRRMAAGSVDAALFAQVRAAVVDGLSDAPALRGVDGSPHGELFAPWFDLRGRIRLCLPAILAAGKPFGVDVLQLVAAALEQVATRPAPAAWGTGHVAVPLTPHQQLGLDAPDGSAPPYLALSGDDDCVLATRALGGTGACLHGPVARWVWDLAGDSRWVVPLGASGDPASPHHHDQQAVWAAGGTIPITRPVTEESA